MSATGRPKKSGAPTQRDPDDHYETPEWAVRAIWPHVRPVTGNVLDPCCGAGAIFRTLCPVGLESDAKPFYSSHLLFGVEIDPGRAYEAAHRAHCVLGEDFLTAREPLPGWAWRPRLVLTNPPYKLAQEFVQRSLEIVDPTHGEVCMLLRLGFLASQKRGEWLRSHIPDEYVLSERPSFTADGKTDAADYCWLVWGKNRLGRLHILPAEPYGREPKKARSAPKRRRLLTSAIDRRQVTIYEMAGVPAEPKGR